MTMQPAFGFAGLYGKKATQECPCGYFSDPQHECTCTALMIQRYRSKISGPLLDRIDIHVEVPPLKFQELSRDSVAEPSLPVQARVRRAREIQQQRLARTKIHCNAQMSSRHLKSFCQVDEASRRLLETAINKLGLSARAYTRILKVARTIADLEGAEHIQSPHISEAIQYRSLDRQFRF
jgi:magnesium chelatase family protein